MHKLPRTSVKAVGASQGPGPNAAINMPTQPESPHNQRPDLRKRKFATRPSLLKGFMDC
jgi:hypothetical protein